MQSTQMFPFKSKNDLLVSMAVVEYEKPLVQFIFIFLCSSAHQTSMHSTEYTHSCCGREQKREREESSTELPEQTCVRCSMFINHFWLFFSMCIILFTTQFPSQRFTPPFINHRYYKHFGSIFGQFTIDRNADEINNRLYWFFCLIRVFRTLILFGCFYTFSKNCL